MAKAIQKSKRLKSRIEDGTGDKSRGGKGMMRTKLRVGDPVIVLSGGNKKTQKLLKNQTGKILRFLPKRDRVVVEGLNMIIRHKRAMTSNEPSGKIQKEGSIHISNVMYYREDLKRAVRLISKRLDDGRKVRGFRHPETKSFEQIDV